MNATMARTMTPSGTPRPMPTLAEALRPPGRGVDEAECIIEETDVEEAGKGAVRRDEEVDMGEAFDMGEEVDRGEGSGRSEKV